MIKKTLAKWQSGHIGRLLGESLRSQGWLYGIAMMAMVVVSATTAGTAWMMENIVNTMTEPEMRSQVFLVAGAVIALFFGKESISDCFWKDGRYNGLVFSCRLEDKS